MKNQNKTNAFLAINIKKILAAFLLIFIANAQFSCKKKDVAPSVSIVGKWKLSNVESPGAGKKEIKEFVDGFKGIVWEYKKNGEMTVSGKDIDGSLINESGTYTISNNSISATGKGDLIDMEANFSIKGNELSIDFDSKDFVMIFTRIK